jgi:hypothetical protein
MITACLISSSLHWNQDFGYLVQNESSEIYDSIDGPSEEEAYLHGEGHIVV